jgi:hypothetical protein
MTYACAFCGEDNEVCRPDAGRRQTFTEDCASAAGRTSVALVVDDDGEVELDVPGNTG